MLASSLRAATKILTKGILGSVLVFSLRTFSQASQSDKMQKQVQQRNR
jgi:hypothetical protein